MNSLKGGCSVDTGFMGVPWMGSLVRPMNGSYQYWRYVIRLDPDVCKRSRNAHGFMTLREGKILVELTQPCGMEVRGHSLDSDPWWIMVCVGSDHGCTGGNSKTDRVQWDMVPWPVRHGGTEPWPWPVQEILPWKLCNRTQSRIRKPGTFHIAARVSPASDQGAPPQPLDTFPREEFEPLMIIIALTTKTIHRGGKGRLLRSESSPNS
uniref:Uncharacterized protein n=1 Tax=Brassica oleracea var. oleracea TaxID=109376 RepID=A0A0D3BFL4_BRAOL